jgi:4-hydroxybenzoate polyprenyltransferase
MLALIELSGDLAGLGALFQYLLVAVAAHLVWLVLFWDIGDPRDCLRRFKASRWTGLLVVGAIVLGRALQ